MNGCLVDSNVLSELRKAKRCDAGVRQWFEETAAEELFISVLVLGEIRKGIERIRPRDPAKARALEKWLLGIAAEFPDRLLPVDDEVADQWARLGLQKSVPILDAFLAATARVHNLTIVSRDEEGFRNAGVRVINPFSKSEPKGKAVR
ncbi:MAG TPA: type II toxin-antitoxin system VapC family toxin [Verrucomicrobiae bacterium]|nr:type II toxin-antitoxin system VapC family toxin [Verrucomicrobiae bacterium]